MNPTQKVPKYKDPVLDATGKQIGVAVFDPNTGKALEGAEAFNPNTGTPITSDMMAPKAELKLPEKTVDTTASSLINEETLKAESSIDKEQTKLQTERDTQVTDISKLIQDIAGTEAKQTQYATDAGADTANEKIQNVDDEMLVQSRALKAKIEQIRSNPFITQNMASLLANDEERKSASYIADLSITKSILNRDYDRAIKTAERKVEAELAPMKAELEAKKFVFDNNKDYFNTVQKAKFDRLIKEEDRKYNDEKDKLDTINKLVITAQQNGADQATIDKIRNAKDTTEASVAIGKYASDPLERNIKERQLAKLNQDISQDKVKFGERNAVSGGGASAGVVTTATPENTISQISFLKNTIADAKSRASVSGRSVLRQKLGANVQGANRFTELQTLTDTLKTNILTMMVDPNVKKFFGPQMTNRDVELMTAGGTTLNPNNQTPESLNNELKRLEDLFARAEKAVKQGTATEQHAMQSKQAIINVNSPLMQRSK